MRDLLKSGLCVLLSFVFFPLLSSTAALAASAVKPITIGFIPGEDPQLLKENGEAIAKLLQAKIGVPVKIFVSQNYSELVDAMAEKKVDFAMLSAMTFVFAEKKAGAKVLMKKVWDGPFYYATILTRRDQNLTKLSQLKGKRLAYVDEKSASGYLYPEVYFKKNGIDSKSYFKDIVYTGNHPESIKQLREGRVDAAAVFSNDAKGKDTAWERFPGKDANKKSQTPHRLWISEPIPNDPFCVRQEYYDANPKISHDLMFALIELAEDQAGGASFKKLLGVTSLMLATSQQYEPVREMVKSLDLKLETK